MYTIENASVGCCEKVFFRRVFIDEFLLFLFSVVDI